MSKNKFLDLMILVEDQKWTVRNGEIRNEKEQCPICAVVEVLSDGKIQEKIWAMTAWTKFNDWVFDDQLIKDHDEIGDIMTAADVSFSPLRKELEKRLHVNQ